MNTTTKLSFFWLLFLLLLAGAPRGLAADQSTRPDRQPRTDRTAAAPGFAADPGARPDRQPRPDRTAAAPGFAADPGTRPDRQSRADRTAAVPGLAAETARPDEVAVADAAPALAPESTNSAASAEDLERARLLKKLAAEQGPPPPATDAKSFQIISDLSIFNPNRRPRIIQQYTNRPVQPRPDWFLLTGTMSYPNQSARQSYAFFDGSSRNFQQAFKPADTIADFKITEIANDHVKLTGTNNKVIKLYLQTQMRKPQGGAWSVLASPDTPVEPAETTPAAADDGSGEPAAATAAPASTGDAGADEVTRKMIERRLQEAGANN